MTCPQTRKKKKNTLGFKVFFSGGHIHRKTGVAGITFVHRTKCNGMFSFVKKKWKHIFNASLVNIHICVF